LHAGEAFFDVHHDATRPFRVIADDVFWKTSARSSMSIVALVPTRVTRSLKAVFG